MSIRFNLLKKPLLLIFSVLLLELITISKVGLYLPSTVPTFYSHGDHLYYIEMAKSFGQCSQGPFCWRVGVPFLAGLFPSIQNGFLLIALISFIISSIGIYLLAEQYGFRGVMPSVAVILFFSIEGVQFALFDFWLPDSLIFAIIVFAIIAILKKDDRLFLLLLGIGILIKETILFVIPLYYSLNTQKLFDYRLFRKTVLLGLPSILIFILIRLFIPIDGSSYNYLTELEEVITVHKNSFTINHYIIVPFGLPLALSLLKLKRNSPFILRYSPYLLAVVSQILIATDAFRVFALVFPVTILMSLKSIDNNESEKAL